MPEININKKYRTRDGRIAVIKDIDVSKVFPVTGIVYYPDGDICFRSWSIKGEYFPPYIENCDLIEIEDEKK